MIIMDAIVTVNIIVDVVIMDDMGIANDSYA